MFSSLLTIISPKRCTSVFLFVLVSNSVGVRGYILGWSLVLLPWSPFSTVRIERVLGEPSLGTQIDSLYHLVKASDAHF